MLKAINVLPFSWDQLKKCLSDIVKEVERPTCLTIGDKTFEVEYYLGGGGGVLALPTGIVVTLYIGALTTEENIHIDQSQKKHWLQCFSLPTISDDSPCASCGR